MLHNRYDIRGGEDESTDAEIKLLRANGHHVELWEAWNKEINSPSRQLSAAVSALWSREWASRVTERLKVGDIDILHVQNHFPLISPSVYYAARKLNVPVVQAIRNYRLICPSAMLFRDGKFCDDCVSRRLKFPAVRHRCYRNSRVGSGVIAVMSAAHATMGTWNSQVSAYIAVSPFVAKMLEQGGVKREKIFVKPNFTTHATDRPRAPGDRGYFLYVGRLTEEKGVGNLVESYRRSGMKTPLKLVGEGNLVWQDCDGVERLGRLPLAEVHLLMKSAKCVVMPGEWAEPFGRVAVEAFAAGTPVVAFPRGGLADILKDEMNGLFIENSDQIADTLARLDCNDNLVKQLSEGAWKSYHLYYTAQKNYETLIEIYGTTRSAQERR